MSTLSDVIASLRREVDEQEAYYLSQSREATWHREEAERALKASGEALDTAKQLEALQRGDYKLTTCVVGSAPDGRYGVLIDDGKGGVDVHPLPGGRP